MKILRTLLAVLALSLGSAISHAAVIFETGPYTSITPIPSTIGVGHLINVSTDIELTQIGFVVAGTGNAKFFVLNDDGTEMLHSSIVALDEETVTWVYSNPFSFLLEAGNAYVVGVIVESSSTWTLGYAGIASYSENGISSEGQGQVFSGYGNPAYYGGLGVAAPFQLISSPTSGEVPEPATYFAVGLGLGLIALYRRKALSR